MQRDVGPEVLDDPRRQRIELRVAVVQPRDQQRGHLEPHIGLVAEVLERVQHGGQLAAADVVVEVLRETLEVDVRGVHVGEELDPRLGADVAGRDGHRLDAELVARVGDVHGVLREDHGVVVGEGHRAAPEPVGRRRDGGRRRLIGELVDLLGLADVPVLAEPAGKVAASRPERQHRRAGQEVVQRLLLDRVDAVAAGPSVAGEHDLVVLAGADEAHAPLALPELAGPWTLIALDPPVLEDVPVSGRDGELVHPTMLAHLQGIGRRPCRSRAPYCRRQRLSRRRPGSPAPPHRRSPPAPRHPAARRPAGSV